MQPLDSILELGCNIGRNLAVLNRRGFRELHAIEINPYAVAAMRHLLSNLRRDILDKRTAAGNVGKLHTETDTQVWYLVFTRILYGSDLAFDAAVAESGGDDVVDEGEVKYDFEAIVADDRAVERERRVVPRGDPAAVLRFVRLHDRAAGERRVRVLQVHSAAEGDRRRTGRVAETCR